MLAGRTVHVDQCPRADDARPWFWANRQTTPGLVIQAIEALHYRTCRACNPMGLHPPRSPTSPSLTLVVNRA